jgi:hypothetical protein
MHPSEIDAWSHRAPEHQVIAASQAGLDAELDWLGLVHSRIERSDLAPFCGRGWFIPKTAAKAAGGAAVELAIVCSMWAAPVTR